MRTQAVFLRVEDAEEVESSFFTFEDELAVRLHSRYASPTMDGPKDLKIVPEGLNFVTLLRHLAGDLAAAREKLTAAEDQHLRVLARVINLRQKRDEVFPILAETFRQVRHSLENLFGSKRGFELAVVAGSTPDSAPRLLQQVGQTKDFLTEPEVELPRSGLRGSTVDRALLAEDLEPGHTALRQVLTALKRARKEAQGTRAEKQAAIAEFDRTYLLTASTLENFFRLVGLDEVADRVRPKGRRGRPRNDEASSEQASAGEGDGDAASSEDAAAEAASSGEAPAVEAPSAVTDADPASQPAPAPAPSVS